MSLFRVPVTFCSLSVTKETLVQDAIAEALDQFGLDRNSANRYNLIEVSLDRGVAERTANPHENMLQLVRNLRKVWLGKLEREELPYRCCYNNAENG